MATTDVVVVGGGIAGGSLAYALAAGGLGVTVLEASTRFEDRVRGETMQPWGVKEARQLGVERALLDAGAHVAAEVRHYVDGIGLATTLAMPAMVDGIPGSLNLAHPAACQALLDRAGSAGATVVRGVTDISVSAGRPASVS